MISIVQYNVVIFSSLCLVKLQWTLHKELIRLFKIIQVHAMANVEIFKLGGGSSATSQCDDEVVMNGVRILQLQ